MKDIERLSGDEQLYSVHAAIKKNRPNIVGPITDVQFFFFPQALNKKVFGKLLHYKVLLCKIGEDLGDYTGFTRIESNFFSGCFAEVVASNFMVSVANQISARYPFVNAKDKLEKIEKLFKNPFVNESRDNTGLGYQEQEEEQSKGDEDINDGDDEINPKRINEEVEWIARKLHGGLSVEQIVEWRKILSNAGESLGNIFSEPQLNVVSAKRTMDFYVRQIKTIRIEEPTNSTLDS